jgi:hypothetical protein
MFNILVYQGFQAFPLLRWYLPIPRWWPWLVGIIPRWFLIPHRTRLSPMAAAAKLDNVELEARIAALEAAREGI